jgi:phosphomannomutase
MNWELDGTFPAHSPDPFVKANNADLCRRVVAEGADLGIATDGDGDRVFFVDNTGENVEPAIVRGWLAQIFLREQPGATICYDIRPGQITVDMILAAGGKPVVTRVGHSLIKQKMLEVGALFGGESSGHFFYSAPWGTFEMTALMIAEILADLSAKNQPLSEFLKPYKKYHASGEINFQLDGSKEEILARLEEHYGEGEINKLDGLSARFKDWWFNVRPSNTEALVRLNVESVNQALTREKVGEISQLITR